MNRFLFFFSWNNQICNNFPLSFFFFLFFSSINTNTFFSDLFPSLFLFFFSPSSKIKMFILFPLHSRIFAPLKHKLWPPPPQGYTHSINLILSTQSKKNVPSSRYHSISYSHQTQQFNYFLSLSSKHLARVLLILQIIRKLLSFLPFDQFFGYNTTLLHSGETILNPGI